MSNEGGGQAPPQDVRECAKCAMPTVHINGACERCAMISQLAAMPPKPKPKTITVRVSVVVLLAILVGVLGEVHIVHGGDSGLHICEKDGWSLSDTFVDMDDYVGKPVLELLDKAKVVRALRACDLLTLRSPDESAPDDGD